MAKLPFFLLAAPLAAAGVPAMAAEDGSGQQVLVHYGDLDLAGADGRRKLNARVKRAAHQVCGGRSVARPNLNEQLIYRTCRTAAIRDADAKIASLLSGEKLARRDPLPVAAR